MTTPATTTSTAESGTASSTVSSTASNYVHRPTIPLPAEAVVRTGDAIWRALGEAAGGRRVIAIDAYPGVDVPGLVELAAAQLPDAHVIDIEERAALPIERIDELIAPALTDDRVFGVMSHFPLASFYDPEKLAGLRDELAAAERTTVVIGWGAALAAPADAVVVLADLARWEIQLRQRAGAPNWRSANGSEDRLRKYKRGFFVEWRTADRHKRGMLDTVDFVLDTNRGVEAAALLDGASFRAALDEASSRPFRVVPFFDPGPWGGQWMKEKLGLDPSAENYAWCFDCVPEENSLLLEASDGAVVEVPSLDLVLARPRQLLGEKTYARFGAEFPIRFDLLDTMQGGNLSLQVHPVTDYIRNAFGMSYTQDESYYLLDADEDAVVYLGSRTGVGPEEFEAELRRAQEGGYEFPADRLSNRIPIKKHDHVAIPSGTIHCSGAGSMVLEISATPFIFTFKLWDWGRLGLDGVPRPIHIDHGMANIDWGRDTEWVSEHLVGQVEVLSETEGVVEERTGLHELEFIEVRRHWFEAEAQHDTCGTVNVLNLVEGDEAEVVSPTGAFAPFVVHYAETFIVPASVGPYTIRRTDASRSERFGTVKASVRGTQL